LSMSCGRLAGRARALREKSGAELSAMFGKWTALPAGFGAPERKRLFFPSRTFWLFLSQVLSADRSCRETLQRFLAWLALAGRKASARTAGYCRARARLRLADLDEVRAGLARKIRAAHLPRVLWFGRPVKVVDGTGLSMPDAPANQKQWPQSKRAKKGCSFPVMRVVALFCLGTGVLIDLAKASLAVSERALFRALWPLLEPGDVVLADRGFCGFAEFFSLSRLGVDCVMRSHARRTVGVTVLKRLGRGDRLILWHKSKTAPRWPAKPVWRAFPETLAVREIRFHVAVRGFRTRSITLATTLLDAARFPASAFADLYRRRWQAELFLRDIKTTMGMDVLRCKTPEMVEKELAMHLIAYNLVRLTMLEAAQKAGVPVERLSFKGTLAAIRSWAPILAGVGERRRRALWAFLLDSLARDPLVCRPDRVEPRARKRRPKNYQLLNKPRRVFKEIRHRNKYVKAA